MSALKWCGLFFLVTSLSYAQDTLPLDKVSFQVSAKEWVSTQTALVAISINATLSNEDLIKARAEIMNNLAKIASGTWHITAFNRSQDSSGLEKLFAEAQARVAQADLTQVYQNAKKVSKPGATYTINSMEFTPSLQEIQNIKAQVRETLYQIANQEIARLNKIYPEQHYTLNRLSIIDGDQPSTPRLYKQQLNTLAVAAAPAIAVSNEIMLSAVVESASNRVQGAHVAN